MSKNKQFIRNMMIRLPIVLAVGALIYFAFPYLQPKVEETPEVPQLTEAEILEQNWVDSIYNVLTEDERIGQTMMIRAHSDKGRDYEQKVMDLVKTYRVGGLCFFQGTPRRQAELLNDYQANARLPLMVSMDAEWGLGMRFKEAGFSFPRQLALGAISDNRLIYDMGAEVARQCKRLGVHVNFAPVVDINNNPDNPVINDRSFGEDRYNVTAKSYMYATGMQDNGLMACIKHFPGHGDTDVDSHYDLPIIPHGLNRLDSVEMYPFKVLVQQKIQSVMMAHLSIPALDDTPNLPSSLSPKITTDLLKEKIGYEGLIFTDGLGMQGARKHFADGEIEVRALAAGNDVLLLPPDVPVAYSAIKKALNEGTLTWSRIEEAVKKILHAKYRLGLTSFTPVSLTNLEQDLSPPKAFLLKEKLIQQSLTTVRNYDNILPVKNTKNIATLAIGETTRTEFQKSVDQYGAITHINQSKNISAAQSTALLNKLKSKDLVIVSLHDMSKYSRKEFGVPLAVRGFLEKLNRQNKVILVIFGSPYSLRYFDDFNHVMLAYREDNMVQDIAAQAVFGAIGTSGKLPVTASSLSTYGTGVPTQSLMRLSTAKPEMVGFDAGLLQFGVDSIANYAIQIGATPGCVVLVAKDRKIVYKKAYGYQTQAKKRPMRTDDIFDLASVTKVAATTLSLMKLYDEGKVDINQTMSAYMPELRGTNKQDLVIKDVLAHRSRLFPWIPFYEETLTKRGKLKTSVYHGKKSDKYSVQVANNIYMNKSYVDTIWKRIHDSELRDRMEYKYSDLGMILFSKMVNDVTGKPLNVYAEEQFYAPLGLASVGYLPLKKHDKNRLVPSENDGYFRGQVLRGHVHDMGAAMLGGVSGHAGLFGNAEDLAVIFQMLLNGGEYGGTRYFQYSTVDLFTNRHPSATRRGIGFDMKQTDQRETANIAAAAPASTFGHLGFTGISAWADKDNQLIYIFLSNRTYPKMTNYKLGREDIRPRIQQKIYEAFVR